jgi:hypothetical protein
MGLADSRLALHASQSLQLSYTERVTAAKPDGSSVTARTMIHCNISLQHSLCQLVVLASSCDSAVTIADALDRLR